MSSFLAEKNNIRIEILRINMYHEFKIEAALQFWLEILPRTLDHLT